MTLNRYAPVVLVPAGTLVTAAGDSMGATSDDLDRHVRSVVQVVVTAIDATSSWQAVLQASVDGVTFFDIVRSAAGFIAGASITVPTTYIFPIHAEGDGIEAAASTYIGLKIFDNGAVVAAGAGTSRPGIPWRALRFGVNRTAAGGGTGITYGATLYSVNDQSQQQGIG